MGPLRCLKCVLPQSMVNWNSIYRFNRLKNNIKYTFEEGSTLIYASGIVSFLLQPKPIIKMKRKYITLEVIKGYYSEDNGDSTRKVACKFTAILPRSFDCRSLEDYTGRIKPFIQKETNNVIASVEVSHLNYLSSRAMDSIYGKR